MRGPWPSMAYLAMTAVSASFTLAAFGQAPAAPLTRLDLLPRQGTSEPAITPVYGQLVLYALPDAFRTVDGGTARKGRFSQSAVLANESRQRWTQMITLSGDEALASSVRTYPQKMLDDLGARMKNSCPDSYGALPLPGIAVGSYETAVAVLGCGTSAGGRSEAVLQVVIKGGMDVYTLAWAVRGTPSRGPLKLDEGEWSDRLRQLSPVRLCAIVPNEQPPFPSCLKRR